MHVNLQYQFNCRMSSPDGFKSSFRGRSSRLVDKQRGGSLVDKQRGDTYSNFNMNSSNSISFDSSTSITQHNSTSVDINKGSVQISTQEVTAFSTLLRDIQFPYQIVYSVFVSVYAAFVTGLLGKKNIFRMCQNIKLRLDPENVNITAEMELIPDTAIASTSSAAPPSPMIGPETLLEHIQKILPKDITVSLVVSKKPHNSELTSVVVVP